MRFCRSPRRFPLWLLLLSAGLRLCAGQAAPRDAELGHPPIQNWTMRDYGAFPQNWVARRDAEGRLYFGNRDGVLTFDGRTWRVLPVPGLFIRGLEFGTDGRLYVGGVDQLGYFERDRLGEWGPFVSLRDRLPPEDRALGDIWSVTATSAGVFFTTDKRLLRWHDGAFKVWRFEGEWNVNVFRAGDRIYVHRREDGLRLVVGDELALVADLPELRSARLCAVLPWGSDGLLLAWPRDGLHLLEGGRLRPWAPDWQPWFRSHGVSRVQLLDGDRLAVSTARDGVALFDSRGGLVQRIDTSTGLFNPIVRDVLRDAEGSLWFALNHGVARVDALAGFTLFDAQNGLARSTVLAVARHEGVFYAASAEGLFVLRPAAGDTMARFERVPSVDSPVYALLATPAGLLVGTRSGLLQLGGPDEAPVRLSEGECLSLLAARGDPRLVWVGGNAGVYPLRYDGARWSFGERLAGPRTEMRTLVELPDGSLWAATPTRGLARWAAPRSPGAAAPEMIFESDGLPAGHGWLRIVGWRDSLCVSTRFGLFRWSSATRRFTPLPVPAAESGEGSYNLYGGDAGRLWTFWGRDRGSAHLVGVKPDGTRDVLPGQLVQAMGDVETLWTENYGDRQLLWVGGTFGLARVDLKEAFQPQGGFAAVFGALGRPREPEWRDGTPVWPHGASDLTVRFGATTYRSGPNLEFQSRLAGYEQDWSDWTRTDARSFTNLAGGRYTLHLRARDADGRLGREAAFSFIVLPPWWTTAWAWAGYLLGAALLVWSLIRWRVRASERERERLQRLVAERTCQLAESQQSLVQAKEAAEAANRAKSAFLASMSHELRTPLNSVLGYAQILRRSADVAPPARRAVETIQRSGDHLLQLINEVLDLAKVEAGRIELHEAEFGLGRFAESITELFVVRAAEKGLAFEGPAPDRLAVGVRGDEGRLRQVLLNLLGNAFKFTERGRVRWDLRAGAGGLWRIEVEDTGVGISAAEQARVFEPFYQSSAQPTLARQGTGLGLAISAHLVELMGGRLQLESAPGKGSRFWFEIPLPVIESAPAEAVAAEAGTIVGYRGRRRRLLVVDDERTNRAVLEEMLGPVGFLIEEADGAEAARAAVARQAPDAVLLDLRMPGDDGFTLAREWRASGVLQGAKVLALSASVLPEQQADALAAGCDAFLAKPFREEQLLRVLGSLLGLDWLQSESLAPSEPAVPTEKPGPSVHWEAGLLQRLLQLAEHGDALRLGEELAGLARRGAAWAAAVAPWQKLAGGYQMEALSRSIEQTLRGPSAAS